MERTSILLIAIIQSAMAATVVDPRYYNTNRPADFNYGRHGLDQYGTQHSQVVSEADRTFPGAIVQQLQPYGAATSHLEWTPIVLQRPQNAAPIVPPKTVDLAVHNGPEDYDVVTFAPPSPAETTAAVAFVTPLRPTVVNDGRQNTRGNHNADDLVPDRGGHPDRDRLRGQNGIQAAHASGGNEHRPRNVDGDVKTDATVAGRYGTDENAAGEYSRRPSQRPQQPVYDKKYAQASDEKLSGESLPPPVRDLTIHKFEDRFRDNYLQFVNEDAVPPRKNGISLQHATVQQSDVDGSVNKPHRAESKHSTRADADGNGAHRGTNRNQNANQDRENNKNRRPVHRVRNQVRITNINEGRDVPNSDDAAVTERDERKSRPHKQNRPNSLKDFEATDVGVVGSKKRLRGNGDAAAGTSSGEANDGHLVPASHQVESSTVRVVRRRKLHRTRRPHYPVVTENVFNDVDGFQQQSSANDDQNDSDRVSNENSSSGDQRRFTPRTALANDYDGADDDAAEGELLGGYGFGYTVLDESSGTDFGQWERREPGRSGTVTGQYRVLLPDGRTQTVDYNADLATGYKAVVTYEGVQRHPAPPLPAIVARYDTEDTIDETSSE